MGRNEEFGRGRVPWQPDPMDVFHKNVSMVPVESLMPLAHQPVIQDHVKNILPSIQEKGVQEPVQIAYKDSTGEANIGDGNHRLHAAVEAGLTHVPATVMYDVAGAPYGSTPVGGPRKWDRESPFSPDQLTLPRGGYPEPHPKRQSWDRRVTLRRIIRPLRAQKDARDNALERENRLNPQEQQVHDQVWQQMDPEGYKRNQDSLNTIMKLLGY